jgi:hypothetical protein
MEFRNRTGLNPIFSLPTQVTLIWQEESWNYFWLYELRDNWMLVAPRKDPDGNEPKTYNLMLIPIQNIVSMIFTEKIE